MGHKMKICHQMMMILIPMLSRTMVLVNLVRALHHHHQIPLLLSFWSTYKLWVGRHGHFSQSKDMT
jgi:hypothetical protein